MTRRRARSGCPGLLQCELFALSHDGRLCHLGCVDDLERPCRVNRGEWDYDQRVQRAIAEVFRRVRARLWPEEASANGQA